MGPDATTDFLTRLARLTPADRDQDHVPTLVYSDTSTPDRSEAITADGPSPLPALLRGIEFLNGSGCGVIAIPCNSAHHWYDQLASTSAAPIPHIVDAAATRLANLGAGGRAAGVMATDGTTRAGIYHHRLSRFGISSLDLTDLGSTNPIMKGIRAAKAGDQPAARDLLLAGCRQLIERGAEALIFGCTDISAALAEVTDVDGVPVVDSSESLAQACLIALGIDARVDDDRSAKAGQPR